MIPRSRRSPGGGNDKPTPVCLPGEFCEQSNLVDYSPWGRKESDTPEQLTHLQLNDTFGNRAAERELRYFELLQKGNIDLS